MKTGTHTQVPIPMTIPGASVPMTITAQKLALQSGFRNYNTFGVAFKKIMGMTATEWMRNDSECGHLQN